MRSRTRLRGARAGGGCRAEGRDRDELQGAVFFLLVGAIEVVHGHLMLRRFVAFNALLALANTPVIGLLSLWDEFQYAHILLGRLDDVLEAEPEAEPGPCRAAYGADAFRPRGPARRHVPLRRARSAGDT